MASAYGSVPDMSCVLVTGGSGVLGRHVVASLRERGDDVRVISRRPGAGTHRGDLATGEGVREALDGVELVVHAASNAPSGRTDLRQTQTLLEAARHVQHLLYISVVGIDAMPYGYYKRKLACERAIADSEIPHTILRATQFHQLLERALRAFSRLPLAPLPLSWQVQPVAAGEVAQRIAALLASEPVGRAEDFGGPEVLDCHQVVQIWRAHNHRPRAVINLPAPGRTARAFRLGLNTTPDHAEGKQTWTQYIRSAETSAGPGTTSDPPRDLTESDASLGRRTQRLDIGSGPLNSSAPDVTPSTGAPCS
jgi:uncharacterized protein YbjT (DUF2867 family)